MLSCRSIITVLSILTVAACASSHPDYTPDGPDTYQAWRACRVAYEDEKNPPGAYSTDTNSLLYGGAISNMIGNSKLEGPEMDKAVNACMKAKGYSVVK